MKQEMQRESTAIELMQGRIADLGISQTELAARCGVHVQTLSAIMHGRRDIPIGLSVKLDVALGLTPGSIAQAQTSDLVAKEIKQIRIHDIQKRKMVIL